MRPFLRGARVRLIVLGVVSLAMYDAIRRLSPAFGIDGKESTRPLLKVLGFFASLFVVYFLAVRCTERPDASSKRGLLGLVFLFAILFRAELLFSTPIQERDIYRYLWDGEVGRLGVDPFAYSPSDVAVVYRWLGVENALECQERKQTMHPSWWPIFKIAETLRSDAKTKAILERVYYPDIPTVYPPTGQCVFRIVASLSRRCDLNATVVCYKAAFVGLDLVCCLLAAWLCRIVGVPEIRVLLYAWCPLVVKEVANSGHMDVVAVLPMLLALCVYLRHFGSAPLRTCAATGGLLGLSFAAKYYAIWILPLLIWRIVSRTSFAPSSDRRFARLIAPPMALSMTFLATALASFVPHMDDLALWRRAQRDRNLIPSWIRDIRRFANPIGRHEPWDGLETFAQTWEMNAPFFRFVHDNLTAENSDLSDGGKRNAWFCFVPYKIREHFDYLALTYIANGRSWFSEKFVFGAGFLARIAMLGTAFSILCWLCTRAGDADAAGFCELVFFALASFWLLSPTLNPWYIVWFLPLLPFVRVRAWRFLPAFAMLYYLRFWFESTNPIAMELARLGLPTGVRFFDDIVVFVEFLPWAIWMLVETWLRRGQPRVSSVQSAL